MKKIFIVSGELSGDKTGAWYLDKLKKEKEDLTVCAVGGDCLKASGAKIYSKMEKLNVTGVVEILKKLKFIFKFLKKLSLFIHKNNFSEVVVVDFPGFNLRLIKRLKKLNPEIKITYLAPPQLWAWGSGRVKIIKKYCDRVIVLYPFEVEWYNKRDVVAEYLGNPIYEKVESFLTSREKFKVENKIAILPGSRESEINKLFPFFADIVKRFKRIYPNVKFILPLSESLNLNDIEKKLRKTGVFKWGRDISIVQGEKDKLEALSTCCLAISKPGTVALELSLLRVPTVIVYKASWITYLIAKAVVKIKYMALPNLFLKKPVFKEFIQGDCKGCLIFDYANTLYKDFHTDGLLYRKNRADLLKIKEMFLK